MDQRYRRTNFRTLSVFVSGLLVSLRIRSAVHAESLWIQTNRMLFAVRCPRRPRGHYNTRDAVLPLAHLADPLTSVETPCLIPSHPALRPADIFCSAAIPGCLAALDIGICSPNSAGAGGDCCAAMFDRKIGHYRAHLPELQEQNIV